MAFLKINKTNKPVNESYKRVMCKLSLASNSALKSEIQDLNEPIDQSNQELKLLEELRVKELKKERSLLKMELKSLTSEHEIKLIKFKLSKIKTELMNSSEASALDCYDIMDYLKNFLLALFFAISLICIFPVGKFLTKKGIELISLLPTPFGSILMFSLLLIPGAIVLFLPNISKDTRKIIMGWSCACFIIGLYFSMFFI